MFFVKMFPLFSLIQFNIDMQTCFVAASSLIQNLDLPQTESRFLLSLEICLRLLQSFSVNLYNNSASFQSDCESMRTIFVQCLKTWCVRLQLTFSAVCISVRLHFFTQPRYYPLIHLVQRLQQIFLLLISAGLLTLRLFHVPFPHFALNRVAF